VDVEAVVHADVSGRNDVGLAVEREADVADQPFVEDRVYVCLVINTALGEALELGAPGRRKLVHSTNVP
jgi:hypothetical protein